MPVQQQNPTLLSALAGLLNTQQQQQQTPQNNTTTYAPQGLGSDDPNLNMMAGFNQTTPASSGVANGGGGDPTEVSPVVVPASKSSAPAYQSLSAPPTPSQLSNFRELTNATAADQNQPYPPTNNRGFNGVLGSVLGHLGDAFLVQANKSPEYQPRIDQQRIAQAMVGAETDPFTAAARVSALGLPQSTEIAQKLIEQGNQAKLREQIQKQNFQYQQARIDSQHDSIFARRAPAAQGFVQGVTDPKVYAQKYGLLDAQVKAVDPNRSAADVYDIPTPENFQPGLLNGAGMTSNQQQISADKSAQRGVAMRDTDVMANSRTNSAAIGANSRPTSSASLTERIMNIPANQRTQEQQAYLNKQLKPNGIALGGQMTTGSGFVKDAQGNLVANSGHPVSPDQARSLPPGTHFLTNDGRWLVR